MPRITARRYFRWLCRQVKRPKDYGRWDLLSELHLKQFTWSVANDGNRIEDAAELRREFYNETGMPVPDESEGVSVLEVIVALSRRVAFDADGRADRWAWQLIENLGLHHERYVDPVYSKASEEISDILDNLVWRRYEPSGLGGFFPLAFPAQDQTQVEIWYQMAAYLEEQHPDHG